MIDHTGLNVRHWIIGIAAALALVIVGPPLFIGLMFGDYRDFKQYSLPYLFLLDGEIADAAQLFDARTVNFDTAPSENTQPAVDRATLYLEAPACAPMIGKAVSHFEQSGYRTLHRAPCSATLEFPLGKKQTDPSEPAVHIEIHYERNFLTLTKYTFF